MPDLADLMEQLQDLEPRDLAALLPGGPEPGFVARELSREDRFTGAELVRHLGSLAGLEASKDLRARAAAVLLWSGLPHLAPSLEGLVLELGDYEELLSRGDGAATTLGLQIWSRVDTIATRMNLRGPELRQAAALWDPYAFVDDLLGDLSRLPDDRGPEEILRITPRMLEGFPGLDMITRVHVRHFRLQALARRLDRTGAGREFDLILQEHPEESGTMLAWADLHFLSPRYACLPRDPDLARTWYARAAALEDHNRDQALARLEQLDRAMESGTSNLDLPRRE